MELQIAVEVAGEQRLDLGRWRLRIEPSVIGTRV